MNFRERMAGRASALAAFLRDQAGASFIIVALAFPVVLGAAGIGVDAVLWYMDKRENQTLADNGAVAARIALSRDPSADLQKAVEDAVKKNGFEHGVHGTVIVNNPPQSGPNAGDPLFVEVLVQEQAKLYFSRMMVSNAFTVQARAVSGISFFGEHCVVALDETADRAINVTGTGDLISSCGTASNSSSAEAVYVGGKATLLAQPIQAYGDIYIKDKNAVAQQYPPQVLSERVENPYEGVLTGLQADASCVGENNAVALNTEDSPVSPGRFCAGISINNGNIVFNPGLYIIDNGSMAISGGTVTGDGVTFILTAMDATDLGSFNVTGGTVDLRAPTTDEAAATGGYQGMLFIQDPYVPNLDTLSVLQSKFNGGSTMIMDGALYFPDMDVDYSGGSAGDVSCTLVIARTVTVSGTAHLENDETACEAAGVTSGVRQTRVRLFE